jgi:CRP-like cAMP-binding protein
MFTNRRPDPKVEALREVDLFRRCSTAELREVARITTACTFAAGALLCRQGAYGRQAFVVLDGQAVADVDGTVVGEIGPGAVVGELALLDNRPRVATVTAVTPVRTLVLSAAEFSRLLEAAPSAARRMLVDLGGRLRTADLALAAGGN